MSCHALTCFAQGGFCTELGNRRFVHQICECQRNNGDRAWVVWSSQAHPADALVAVNHAGALPQALPNPVLDMTGLCDRHIAREVTGGLHHKFDPAYVLAHNPRLIVLNSRIQPGTSGIWYHPGYWVGETALVARPEFRAHYRPVPRFWRWQWQGQGGGGYVLLYERVGE